MLPRPEQSKLSDDLRPSVEECLSMLCVYLESEKEVFGGGERNVGATSADDNMEEGG